MATNIAKAVAQIEGNLAAVLPGDVIAMLCGQLGYKKKQGMSPNKHRQSGGEP